MRAAASRFESSIGGKGLGDGEAGKRLKLKGKIILNYA